jgi:serine/threonine protein kinase
MAEIFLAEPTADGPTEHGPQIVIKKVLPHLTDDTAFLEMFLDEARIAARLAHPHIVQIFDLGRVGDSWFIAMEYVRGEDLSAMHKEAIAHGGLLPYTLTARILEDVCEALHYAHSKNDFEGQPLNIIHRDVTPQNIVVGYDGTPKLLDFGIAKAAGKISRTRPGTVKGKYFYMSPEQCRGKDLDGRSDIFSVGVLLYELTTGSRPFHKETEFETLKAIVTEPFERPEERVPGYPPALARIVEKALSKKRDDRYGTAREMAEALSGYLAESGEGVGKEEIGNYVTALFAGRDRDREAAPSAAGRRDVTATAAGVKDPSEERSAEEVPLGSAPRVALPQTVDAPRDSATEPGKTRSAPGVSEALAEETERPSPTMDPRPLAPASGGDFGVMGHAGAPTITGLTPASGNGATPLPPSPHAGEDKPTVDLSGTVLEETLSQTAPAPRPALARTDEVFPEVPPLLDRGAEEPTEQGAAMLRLPRWQGRGVRQVKPVVWAGAGVLAVVGAAVAWILFTPPPALPETAPMPALDLTQPVVTRPVKRKLRPPAPPPEKPPEPVREPEPKPEPRAEAKAEPPERVDKPEVRPEPRAEPEPRPEPKPRPERPPRAEKSRPEPPKKEAKHPPPKVAEAPKPKGPAVLSIECQPGCIAEVFDGPRSLGQTPVAEARLEPGFHTLTLVNREQGVRKQVRIFVNPGERLRRVVDLK